ncbi:tail fiber protein [Pseudomonas phage PCS4]|uniref:Tail fiber protein n=1 Tax=Pseudomonas phage PCS4 TaxID=2875705 RepID=A0ABY3P9C0_9CAUD|nr:tail fiber protein [Pseudomonas phage PCS4]
MADAPKTTVTYTLNGTDRDFLIPFEYLARKFVQVTLVGVDRKVLTLNIDYRFTQRTIITTTKGWGPADGYQLIEIRRYTSATERLVDFSDGSILRAYDLNTAQVQSLHIAEEGRDIATDTIGVNNDGDLDARGRKIVNLADGVNDFDAVNLRQQRQWAGSALNQADRSKNEADRATAQANASAGSASNAATSAGSAATSASNAAGSNAAAQAQADRSKNEADRATAQANAATSNGATQVELARQQADRSKNEADRATTQANASTASAAASEASRQAALTQANRATAEADRAKTEADKLANVNALAGAIETVTGLDVRWKGYHEFKQMVQVLGGPSFMPQFRMFHENGQSRAIINDGSNILFHDMNTQRNLAVLDASGGFVVGGALYEGSAANRVWTRTTLPENSLLKGTGTINSKGNYNTVSGVPYQNLTPANQVYNGAFEIRENGLVCMGGPSPGHEYNAPGLTFHWGSAIVKKLFMTTDGHLNWGAHDDSRARLGADGNLYGPVWGGWLSTHLANRFGGKQNPHHFQAGRVGIGAPGGGYRQFRVNFHAPMGSPTVQITIYRPALHVAVGRGESWVDGIDENGFTCWVHCEAGAQWDAYIDWMASPAVNVSGGGG